MAATPQIKVIGIGKLLLEGGVTTDTKQTGYPVGSTVIENLPFAFTGKHMSFGANTPYKVTPDPTDSSYVHPYDRCIFLKISGIPPTYKTLGEPAIISTGTWTLNIIMKDGRHIWRRSAKSSYDALSSSNTYTLTCGIIPYDDTSCIAVFPIGPSADVPGWTLGSMSREDVDNIQSVNIGSNHTGFSATGPMISDPNPQPEPDSVTKSVVMEKAGSDALSGICYLKYDPNDLTIRCFLNKEIVGTTEFKNYDLTISNGDTELFSKSVTTSLSNQVVIIGKVSESILNIIDEVMLDTVITLRGVSDEVKKGVISVHYPKIDEDLFIGTIVEKDNTSPYISRDKSHIMLKSETPTFVVGYKALDQISAGSKMYIVCDQKYGYGRNDVVSNKVDVTTSATVDVELTINKTLRTKSMTHLSLVVEIPPSGSNSRNYIRIPLKFFFFNLTFELEDFDGKIKDNMYSLGGTVAPIHSVVPMRIYGLDELKYFNHMKPIFNVKTYVLDEDGNEIEKDLPQITTGVLWWTNTFENIESLGGKYWFENSLKYDDNGEPYYYCCDFPRQYSSSTIFHNLILKAKALLHKISPNKTFDGLVKYKLSLVGATLYPETYPEYFGVAHSAIIPMTSPDMLFSVKTDNDQFNTDYKLLVEDDNKHPKTTDNKIFINKDSTPLMKLGLHVKENISEYMKTRYAAAPTARVGYYHVMARMKPVKGVYADPNDDISLIRFTRRCSDDDEKLRFGLYDTDLDKVVIPIATLKKFKKDAEYDLYIKFSIYSSEPQTEVATDIYCERKRPQTISNRYEFINQTLTVVDDTSKDSTLDGILKEDSYDMVVKDSSHPYMPNYTNAIRPTILVTNKYVYKTHSSLGLYHNGVKVSSSVSHMFDETHKSVEIPISVDIDETEYLLDLVDETTKKILSNILVKRDEIQSWDFLTTITEKVKTPATANQIKETVKGMLRNELPTLTVSHKALSRITSGSKMYIVSAGNCEYPRGTKLSNEVTLKPEAETDLELTINKTLNMNHIVNLALVVELQPVDGKKFNKAFIYHDIPLHFPVWKLEFNDMDGRIQNNKMLCFDKTLPPLNIKHSNCFKEYRTAYVNLTLYKIDNTGGTDSVDYTTPVGKLTVLNLQSSILVPPSFLHGDDGLKLDMTNYDGLHTKTLATSIFNFVKNSFYEDDGRTQKSDNDGRYRLCVESAYRHPSYNTEISTIHTMKDQTKPDDPYFSYVDIQLVPMTEQVGDKDIGIIWGDTEDHTADEAADTFYINKKTNFKLITNDDPYAQLIFEYEKATSNSIYHYLMIRDPDSLNLSDDKCVEIFKDMIEPGTDSKFGDIRTTVGVGSYEVLRDYNSIIPKLVYNLASLVPGKEYKLYTIKTHRQINSYSSVLDSYHNKSTPQRLKPALNADDTEFLNHTLTYVIENTITGTFTPTYINMVDDLEGTISLKKATVGGKIQLFVTDVTDTDNDHLILISERILTDTNIFKISGSSYSLHEDKRKKDKLKMHMVSDLSSISIPSDNTLKFVYKYIDPISQLSCENDPKKPLTIKVYDFRHLKVPEFILMDHKRTPRPTDDPDVMYTTSQEAGFGFTVLPDSARMAAATMNIWLNGKNVPFADPKNGTGNWMIPSSGRREKNLKYYDPSNALRRLQEGMNIIKLSIKIQPPSVMKDYEFKVFCHTPNIIKAEDPTHRLPLVHDGEDANTKFTLNPVIPQITDGDSFEILAGSDKQHLVKIYDHTIVAADVTKATNSSTKKIQKLPVDITITNDMIDALTDGMHDIYINYTSKANPAEDNFFKPIGVLLDCVDMSLIQHPTEFNVKDDEKNPNVIPDRIESNTFTPTFKVHFPADNHRSATGVKSWIEKYDTLTTQWVEISDKKDNDDSAKDLEFLTTTPFENGEDKVRVVIDVVGGARQFEYNLRTHIPQRVEVTIDKQHHINNVGEQIDFTLIDTESQFDDVVRLYVAKTAEDAQRLLLKEYHVTKEDLKTLQPADSKHEYHYSITTTITDDIAKLDSGDYKVILNYIPKDAIHEEDKILDQVLSKDLVLIHPDDIVKPSTILLHSEEKTHEDGDDADILYSNLASGIVLKLNYAADSLRGLTGTTVYAKIGDKVVSKQNMALDQEAHSEFLLPLIDLENLSLNNIEIVTDIEGVVINSQIVMKVRRLQTGKLIFDSSDSPKMGIAAGVFLDFKLDLLYVSPGDHIEVYLGDPASDKKFKVSYIDIPDSFKVDSSIKAQPMGRQLTGANVEHMVTDILAIGESTKAYMINTSSDPTHVIKLDTGLPEFVFVEKSELGDIGSIDIPAANKKPHSDSDVDGHIYSTLLNGNEIKVTLPAVLTRPNGVLRITTDSGKVISDEQPITSAGSTSTITIKDDMLTATNNLKVELFDCGISVTKEFVLHCGIPQTLEYKNGDPVDCGFIYLDPSESITSNVLIGNADNGDTITVETGSVKADKDTIKYQPLISHILASVDDVSSVANAFDADAVGAVPTHRYKYVDQVTDDMVQHVPIGLNRIKCSFSSSNIQNSDKTVYVEDIMISNVESYLMPMLVSLPSSIQGNSSQNVVREATPTVSATFSMNNPVIPGSHTYLKIGDVIVSSTEELVYDGKKDQVINFSLNKDLSKGYNKIDIVYTYGSHEVKHHLIDVYYEDDPKAEIKVVDDNLLDAINVKDGNTFKVEFISNILTVTDKVSILIAGDEFLKDQIPTLSPPDKDGLCKAVFNITLDASADDLGFLSFNYSDDLSVVIKTEHGEEIVFDQLIGFINQDPSIEVPSIKLKIEDKLNHSADGELFTVDKHAAMLFSIDADDKRTVGSTLEFISASSGKYMTTGKIPLDTTAIVDQEDSISGILNDGKNLVIMKVTLPNGTSNESHVYIYYTPPPVVPASNVSVKQSMRNTLIGENASKIINPTLVVDIPADEGRIKAKLIIMDSYDLVYSTAKDVSDPTELTDVEIDLDLLDLYDIFSLHSDTKLLTSKLIARVQYDNGRYSDYPFTITYAPLDIKLPTKMKLAPSCWAKDDENFDIETNNIHYSYKPDTKLLVSLDADENRLEYSFVRILLKGDDGEYKTILTNVDLADVNAIVDKEIDISSTQLKEGKNELKFVIMLLDERSIEQEFSIVYEPQKIKVSIEGYENGDPLNKSVSVALGSKVQIKMEATYMKATDHAIVSYGDDKTSALKMIDKTLTDSDIT